MVSLTALALVALPLAAASAAASSVGAAHFSHPRRADLTRPHGRAAMRYRALPRTGRRLAKRGGGGAGTEATLKCLSAHTFALCDGDHCTDMGAVAAGTMCKDNAITWDTTAEASSEDSSAATASYAEIPASSAAPAVVETPEPSTTSTEEAAAVETLSADKPLANNVAVKTSSAADAAATVVDSVQLNVDTGSSSSSDDDDEWECDAEDDASSASSTSWTAATATADAVQLNQQSKAASTTTQASAPAQTSSSSSDSYSGRGTYYYQYNVAGSCGTVHSDSVSQNPLSLSLSSVRGSD